MTETPRERRHKERRYIPRITFYEGTSIFKERLRTPVEMHKLYGTVCIEFTPALAEFESVMVVCMYVWKGKEEEKQALKKGKETRNSHYSLSTLI